ncbi:hypothetical protein ACFLZW_05025 [Chloroflexota bacterium]
MKYVALVIVLVVLVFLVVEFNSRTAELNRLITERDIIAIRLSNRLQEKSVLDQKYLYAKSDSAAEQYGYENKMGRTGDILVIPVASYVSTPTPQPSPVVVATQETNWQRWLSLFIDPPTPTPGP